MKILKAAVNAPIALGIIFLTAGLLIYSPAFAQLPGGFSLYDREAPSLETRHQSAMALSESGDHTGAARALKPLANEGYAAAQYDLAVLHFEGKDASMTDAEAVAWTRKSAEQGYTDAQELMIILPISGFHKLVSHDEAHIYHAKLARNGRANSQHYMGLKASWANDDVTARYWWEKAAAQGHELSIEQLAKLNPEPTPKIDPADIPDVPDFPVFANSPLNTIGDVAASCYWVMSEKQKTEIASATQNRDWGKNGEIQLRQSIMDLAHGVLSDPKQNGGLTISAVDDAIVVHAIASKFNPQSGPSEAYCQDNFLDYLTAYSIADAMAKYNKGG